jgi:hypothetical protein
VFGLGPLFVTIDRLKREIAGHGVHYLGTVPKASGAIVDTSLFFDPGSAPCSAVVGSVTGIGAPVDLGRYPFGCDFRLVQNPHARNPLPPGLLVRGEQVCAREDGDQWQIIGQDIEAALV